MNAYLHLRMSKEVNDKLKSQIRDKLIDNMTLDDVDTNMVINYIADCSIERLYEIYKAAEILDWQLVGRIISVAGKNYRDKEW